MISGLGPRVRRALAPLAAALWLAACGGSGGGGGSTGGGGGQPPAPPAAAAPPPTAAEAARFLSQATFGPSEGAIAQLRGSNYAAWITEQQAMPVSAQHLAHLDARLVELRTANPNAQLNANQFYESFWKHAVTAPDQLRERVKFALSEIFVISLRDPAVDVRGAASYYDMPGANAFGNYRTLLEQVTRHLMMGVYLTYLANQKEDPATGRTPDENYAREVLQLMSIGVLQLGPDGAPRANTAGAPLASYAPEDVSNLAKVFTGLSWYHPPPTATTFLGRNRDPSATVRPMIFYPAHHSTSTKTFLGVTTASDPEGDLKAALDAIAAHPNTGPFISRQFIQRLVTSNPTPDYVGRVAAVFNNNGAGVRGDLGAVVRSILLDPEARDSALLSNPAYGKLREPVIRMTHWMRAFGAASASGSWLIPSTSANTSLSQSALAAPSVFNFWRPGYSPPNTRLSARGSVAPEFQVVDEVAVAGYLNTMQTAIDRGFGNGQDVRANYGPELSLANDPAALAERMNLLLHAGSMSPTLKARLTEAIASVPVPAAGSAQSAVDAALLNRVKLAIFLSMAAPEYLVQR